MRFRGSLAIRNRELDVRILWPGVGELDKLLVGDRWAVHGLGTSVDDNLVSLRLHWSIEESFDAIDCQVDFVRRFNQSVLSTANFQVDSFAFLGICQLVQRVTAENRIPPENLCVLDREL